MDWDFEDDLMLGLRGYVRSVTEALGLSGESSYVQNERPATAYLALDGRLPGHPDREVALLWDEKTGWSAAVETHSGEDLVVVARLGQDVVPQPRAVAKWVQRLFRDRRGGLTTVPTGPKGDVTGRLAAYAAFTPTHRSA